MNIQIMNVQPGGAPPSATMMQSLDRLGAVGKRAPLRVFLVEDSPEVRNLLIDYLHVSGDIEIVGYADTEDEAVAAILAEPVDAVIVDLKLRDGGGMAVIQRLRAAKLVHPPILIVFTNHPQPAIRERAKILGADYFFDKSIDYERVRSTLRTLREK
jgi:DNA-binding NarL/FixJ family response regulator